MNELSLGQRLAQFLRRFPFLIIPIPLFPIFRFRNRERTKPKAVDNPTPRPVYVRNLGYVPTAPVPPGSLFFPQPVAVIPKNSPDSSIPVAPPNVPPNSEPQQKPKSREFKQLTKVPMRSQVFYRLQRLTRLTSPITVLLVSDPPTLKMTPEGLMPIITELLPLSGDFEEIQTMDPLPAGVVGDFHNHRESVELLEDDKKIFSIIDRVHGPKIHIIGDMHGWKTFCAFDDPVIIRRDGGERSG